MIFFFFFSLLLACRTRRSRVGACRRNEKKKKKDTRRTPESGEPYPFRCSTRVRHRYDAKNGVSVQPRKWVAIQKRKRHLVFCPFKRSIFATASSNCPFPAEYVVFLRECRYPASPLIYNLGFKTRKLIQTLDHQNNLLFGCLEARK